MLTSTITELAEDLIKLGVNEPEVVALYALVIGLEGVTVLDGTTRLERMKADLLGLETVSKWAEGEGKERWQQQLKEFKQLIAEEG